MGTLKNRCVIIGGGDCSISLLKENVNANTDFVICADSGYDYAVSANIIPDLLIGDFDSIKAVPVNVDKITLPVEKDITDTVAAFYEGIKQNYTSFVLFGGTGGRFEHTYANISLIANASKSGIAFEIIDNKHIFKSITNSSIIIPKKDNQQVSVFAYGSTAFGVTMNGFHYPLNNFNLDPFNGSLGTSNDIVEDFGEISVKNGTLIIIETKM